MNITPVNYRTNYSMTSKKVDKKEQNTAPLMQHDKVNKLNYPPIVVGILNGFCWSCLGFAFDKATSFLFKMKTNAKTSMAVNGIIGVAMGTYAYIQAKKEAKLEAQAQKA